MNKDELYNAILTYSSDWVRRTHPTDEQQYAYVDALLDMVDILGHGDDMEFWQSINSIMEKV